MVVLRPILAALLASTLTIAVASSSRGQDSLRDDYSANFWLPMCEGQGHVAPAGQERVVCGFFLAGILRGYYIGVPNHDQRQICHPPGVTVEQLARVFIAYAREHPNLTHLRAERVAYMAFRDAFPCHGNAAITPRFDGIPLTGND